MPTCHYSFNSELDLLAALQACHDAGVDPAFDSDLDELEGQFQKLRFNSLNQ